MRRMEAPTAARADRRFWIAFAVCAAAALVPLWSVRYLPMADLPQHAAQVSIWLNLDDPAMGFADQFEVHLFVPYVVPYLVPLAIARWIGLLPALKVLVTLAVLGLPLATLRLVLRRGGDPWWALWGFPLAFGMSFYWGFVSFIAAAPLGILFVEEGDAYTVAPTWRRGLAVGSLGLVLFFSHLVVLLAAAAIVGLLAVLRARSGGRWLVRLAPLVPAAATGVAWIATAAGHDERLREWEWGLSPTRLTMLPEYLFDARKLGTTDLDLDHGAVALTVALVVAFLLFRPRVSRSLPDWTPLALAAAAFLAAPTLGFNGYFLAERFAIFLVPFAFAALRDAPSPDRRLARAITFAAAAGWMAVLAVRFAGFDREMEPAERVWRQMEPNRRVTSLIYEPMSKHVRGAFLFIHLAAWAQAEHGGVLDTSFAHLVNLPVQYRPGRKPSFTQGLEARPELFDWETDGTADYFLVQSPPPSYPLTNAPVPILLVAREGDWRLFRRLPVPGRGGGAP
jgi:hypothetical protein